MLRGEKSRFFELEIGDLLIELLALSFSVELLAPGELLAPSFSVELLAPAELTALSFSLELVAPIEFLASDTNEQIDQTQRTL